jgi:tetratricopeptide (TPR) repeat protein
MRTPLLLRSVPLLLLLVAGEVCAQMQMQASAQSQMQVQAQSRPRTHVQAEMQAKTQMQPQTAALPSLALDRFPAEARRSIEAAWRDAGTHATDGAAAGRLAMVLQSWEQWTTALAVYQRAQALAPETFDWWYLAGIIETRIGRPADAARSFDHAIRLTPAYVPARLKLAEALFDSGNLDGSARIYGDLAREAISAATAPPPSVTAALPAVHYGLGRIKAAQGDPAAAATHFEEACRQFAEFGAAHYALALAYRSLGRIEDAQREIALQQRYTNAWPGVDDPVAGRIAPLRDDARAHMERGIAAWKAGKLAEAISEHEDAVRLQPALAQAHANLIVLYGHEKNTASAEAHYRSVVALNSNLGEAHYNYGVLLMDQHREDDAIVAFRNALAVNPHNAPAHGNLGLLLEMRQDVSGAEREYHLAVQDDPTSRSHRFNHGRTLVALGRLDDAIGEFTRVQSPEDAETPRYRYALAVAHLRAGHRDVGLTLAREARGLAERYGQSTLVTSIDRDLASLANR